MSYKTILVHVDQSPHAPARIALAARIAAEQGAHLIGAAMTGISRYHLPWRQRRHRPHRARRAAARC